MLGIYVRLSQEDDESNSIHNQLREGKAYAKQTKLPYEIYNEGQGVSGRNDIKDRPELDRLFKDIVGDKITVVWFRNQNRLERSSNTFHVFANLVKKKKIKVVFGTKEMDWDDPTNFLQSAIMTAINEYQAELQSYQTIKSLLDNAREGKWHGMYPYGYKKGKDGKLAIDKEEAKVVKRIYEMSLQGIGCRKIADILYEDEIPTRYNKIAQNGGKKTFFTVNLPRGKDIKTEKKRKEVKWRDKTVRGIIKNPLYKGDRIYKGDTYKVPNIITSAYWKEVNDHLKENRNTQHGNENKHDYLLRGLMICGRCSSNYHGRVNKRDNYYMCTSKRFPKENCGNRGINRPFIEEFVWSKFFLSGEFDKHLEEYFIEQSDQSKLSVLTKRRAKFDRDHSKLKKERLQERKYLVSGTISEQEYLEDKKIRDLEERKILERISETDTAMAVLVNLHQTQKGVKDDLKEMSEKLSFEKKQEFIAKYLDYIEVDYYGKIYYLKFYFKLPQMQPQLYYVEPNYSLGFNITHQPLVDEDEVDSDDYEVDWEKVYGTMVLNVTHSYWWKAAENMRNGTPGKFPYKPNARKVYLEVKRMMNEE